MKINIPKELRRQFSRAKSALRERLIDEQTLKEARGGVAFEGKIPTLFKKLDIERVYTEGIYRKVGNKTIHFIGNEAVEEQIRSLMHRASKKHQKKIFIENYIQAMEVTGFTKREREEIEGLLNKLSADKISTMLDKGIIKEISFIYGATSSYNESEFEKVFNSLKNGLKKGLSQKEYKTIQERKKKLKAGIRTRFKVLQ